MRISKPFLFILLIFSLTSMLSPITYAETYPQREEFNLKIPFEVNGTIASDSAYCNISISYPNQSYMFNKSEMINQNNGEFSIFINETQTRNLGLYVWTAYCCDGTECAMGYGDFEVTPSGFGDLDFGAGFGLGAGILAIFGMAVLFFIGMFKFENIAFKIMFGSMSAVMVMITILFVIVVITQTAGGYTELLSGYTVVWQVFRWVITIGGLSLVLFAGYVALRLWQFKTGRID